MMEDAKFVILSKVWVIPFLLWSASMVVPTADDLDWFVGLGAAAAATLIGLFGFWDAPLFFLGMWPNVLIPLGCLFLSQKESRSAVICGILSVLSTLFWPLWGAKEVEVELIPFVGYWVWLSSSVSLVVLGIFLDRKVLRFLSR